ncbi:MAG: hypothetical protein AAFX56_14895 [Pseudomonadota bacterium]
MILSKDAFDPDAVFLDDIVDDQVLPYLSLEVDGLTDTIRRDKASLELRPDDVVPEEPEPAVRELPKSKLDPEQLEVYGWESSLWRKLKTYLRF